MLSTISPKINSGTGLAADGRRANRSHAPRRMLALLLLLGIPVAAQSPGMQAQAARDGGTVDLDLGSSSGAGVDAHIEGRRFAALNQQRQKRMIIDANKLLKLAQELNADADAGGTILSPAQRLHKAEEIEKLAKNVKDRMTYSIGAPQDLMAPFAPWQQ